VSTDLFIHATGLCGLVLNVFALLRTCERRLRIHTGLAGALWALNNLLLGAHAAAALSIVSAGRSATSAATLDASGRRRHAACAGFVVLTLAVGLATWQGWASAFIVVASLLSTLSMFYLRGRNLRLVMLLVSALWMVHAWQHDSWEQMAANLVTAAVALVGALRVGREKL
jgi:Bacterial inner membrane protein